MSKRKENIKALSPTRDIKAALKCVAQTSEHLKDTFGPRMKPQQLIVLPSLAAFFTALTPGNEDANPTAGKPLASSLKSEQRRRAALPAAKEEEANQLHLLLSEATETIRSTGHWPESMHAFLLHTQTGRLCGSKHAYLVELQPGSTPFSMEHHSSLKEWLTDKSC